MVGESHVEITISVPKTQSCRSNFLWLEELTKVTYTEQTWEEKDVYGIPWESLNIKEVWEASHWEHGPCKFPLFFVFICLQTAINARQAFLFLLTWMISVIDACRYSTIPSVSFSFILISNLLCLVIEKK